MKTVEAPKPLEMVVENGETRATFNRGELARFVETTEEPLLVLEDGNGNKSAISVGLIEESLRELSEKGTPQIPSPRCSLACPSL